MNNASSSPLLYFKIAIVHSVKDFAQQYNTFIVKSNIELIVTSFAIDEKCLFIYTDLFYCNFCYI